jgi:hypothetical protein
MEANVSDELKTCTWCGRECRVETFGPSEFIEKPFSIWVCSNAEIFGGTCTHALAYMSEEDWQEEPRSDELIEAMARCIHAELSRANVMAYLDMPDTTPETLARAILPVIRAHLEPTSEMVDAALAKGKAANLEPPLLELMRKGLLANWRDMLAASPIGEIV